MAPNPTEALRKVLVSSGVVGVEVFSNDWIWGQGNRNRFVWENFGTVAFINWENCQVPLMAIINFACLTVCL